MSQAARLIRLLIRALVLFNITIFDGFKIMLLYKQTVMYSVIIIGGSEETWQINRLIAEIPCVAANIRLSVSEGTNLLCAMLT